MKLRVLGCAGSGSTTTKTSAFLINDRLLLDGGSICSTLVPEEIASLQTIFVSHPHFDHIKGLPTLAETLLFMNRAEPVTIYASDPAIHSLRTHVMNDIIWPDFSKLPSAESAVVKYRALAEKETVATEGITVTPWFLYPNHTDFGYLLDDGRHTLLYTSDIGPDADLNRTGRVPESLIVEVSFPNENEELARLSGHLTPLLMAELLKKLPATPRYVFVSHIKTYFRGSIISQLQSLGLSNLVILNDGDMLEL